MERIDRRDAAWSVRTPAQDLRAAQVIVATDYEGTPAIPAWRGRAEYSGRVLHSCEYKNPEPYLGSKVLIVGPGCSGMEIAYDLAAGGAAQVWLSARTPPNILLPAGCLATCLGSCCSAFRLGSATPWLASVGGWTSAT